MIPKVTLRDWLNGKKSVIALIFFLVGSGFYLITGQAVDGFAGADTWQGLIAGGLLGIGTIFGVPGLVHKWAKIQSVADRAKAFAAQNPEIMSVAIGMFNAAQRAVNANRDRAAAASNSGDGDEPGGEELDDAESSV